MEGERSIKKKIKLKFKSNINTMALIHLLDQVSSEPEESVSGEFPRTAC